MIFETHYIACGLGAESGRVMLGALGDGRVSLEEIRRILESLASAIAGPSIESNG